MTLDLRANSMVWASDQISRRAYPAIPPWFSESTFEPVSVGTADQEAVA